jgi:hypothetical protein
VSVLVVSTPRAAQQIDQLRARQREQLADFIDQVKATGCAALAYRLTGDLPLNRLCVKHLGGALRVVVAFESPAKVWILLVGPHDDRDPGIDVYTELYELIGFRPADAVKRSKPVCCADSGEAPVMSDVAQELAERAVMLRRTRRQ